MTQANSSGRGRAWAASGAGAGTPPTGETFDEGEVTGMHLSGLIQNGHVSMIGFAICLVINATQIWGGIFPFLPTDFQTPQVTLLFYVSQSLAFCGTFVASCLGSYVLPQLTRSMLVGLVNAVVFAGSACVIAIMYLPSFTLALVLAGGVLLGVGCTGMLMLWQRLFAAMPTGPCNARLMVGTALASVLYFALYLIPAALTAFLVPVVFLPLCSLTLTLTLRQTDLNQPMFEDVPRQNAAVYGRILRDFWRSGACVGALAFCAGLVRALAVTDVAVRQVVNISSMAGSLISVVVLLAVWSTRSFRVSLRVVFRLCYPLVALGFLLLPFVGSVGMNIIAGLSYAVFSLVTLIMMMQSASISRERGANPVFVYAFFGSLAYIPQSIGFVLGWFAEGATPTSTSLALLALFATFVLGLALYASSGRFASTYADGSPCREDQIEFAQRHIVAAPAANSAETPQAVQASPVQTAKRNAAKPRESAEAQHADGRAIIDRLSKQCLILQQRYILSARETEVMELIARGRTVASIAEELFVSENTVRTHSKHIYTKLNVHSKAELSQLIAETSI